MLIHSVFFIIIFLRVGVFLANMPYLFYSIPSSHAGRQADEICWSAGRLHGHIGNTISQQFPHIIALQLHFRQKRKYGIKL